MDSRSKIQSHLDGCREESLAFLRQLVAFDSSTIHHGLDGQELAVQEWLAGTLKGWGFEVRLFEPDNDRMHAFPDFSPGHNYKGRPNLVARLPGQGDGRSLILNGHVDTMPAGDREKWTHDPWGGEIDGGQMYGLGVCDMKAGVAAMILATRALQEAGLPPQGDVLLECVVDEEGGGNGTLACVVEGYRADAAIVTEPTRSQVQPASRGVLLLQVDVTGKATHACLKWGGVNAIEKGMKIIQAMIELERVWLATRRSPLLPPPTITIGRIDGGMAGSQVPGECMLQFDVKYLPVEIDATGRERKNTGDSIKAEVEAYLSRVFAGDPWLAANPPKLTWYQHCIPHYQDPAHPLVDIVRQGLVDVTGRGIVSGFPAGCDARHLQNKAGIPTLIFGPGDLQFAHSIDEHVDVEEYLAAIKVLALAIHDWTTERHA
jgi:acetylornithine deacetylase